MYGLARQSEEERARFALPRVDLHPSDLDAGRLHVKVDYVQYVAELHQVTSDPMLAFASFRGLTTVPFDGMP